MKRKMLMKRGLAAVLSAAMALTFTPDVGILSPQVVYASANPVSAGTNNYITSVKFDGRAIAASQTDGIVMGRSDSVSVEVTAAASIKKVEMKLMIGNPTDDPSTGLKELSDSTVTLTQKGKTATIVTNGTKPADSYNPEGKFKLVVIPDGSIANSVYIPVHIGKYQASYYFMTAEEYKAGIAAGETIEPDAKVWMPYQAGTTNKSKLIGGLGVDVTNAYKAGYSKTVAWTKLDGTTSPDGDIADNAIETDGKVFAKWTALTYDIKLNSNVANLKKVNKETTVKTIDDGSVAKENYKSGAKFDEEIDLPKNDYVLKKNIL